MSRDARPHGDRQEPGECGICRNGIDRMRQSARPVALEYRIPTMFPVSFYPEVGGLMSYGVSFTTLFRRAADYVDKIARGAKPANLPIERPDEFELVVNLKTAQASGVRIPPSLLLRADRVIE